MASVDFYCRSSIRDSPLSILRAPLKISFADTPDCGLQPFGRHGGALWAHKTLDANVDKILCYVKEDDDSDTQWRIALPEAMLMPTVEWFHQVLGHPREK